MSEANGTLGNSKPPPRRAESATRKNVFMFCPCRAPTLRCNVTQGDASLASGYAVLRLQRGFFLFLVRYADTIRFFIDRNLSNYTDETKHNGYVLSNGK